MSHGRPSRRHSAGASNKAAAMPSKVAESGRVTKVVQSPMLMVRAWRMDCSAMGARMSPTIKGAAGKSKRRMAKPMRPKANSKPTLKTELPARMAANLGYTVTFALDATHTFDRSLTDGTIIPADTVYQVNAASLSEEFATIRTTAELTSF